MYNYLYIKSMFIKGKYMTNLSVTEKRALEEVFIVLDERKMSKLEVLKKYVMFYKMMNMFVVSKKRFSLIKS